MHSNIESLIRRTRFGDRIIAWTRWYYNSFIFNLVNNQRTLERDSGIKLGDLIEPMFGPEGRTPEAVQRVKGLVQRRILEAIKKKHAPDPQYRLRNKIMRWYPKGSTARTYFHPSAPPTLTDWPGLPMKMLPKSTVCYAAWAR